MNSKITRVIAQLVTGLTVGIFFLVLMPFISILFWGFSDPPHTVYLAMLIGGPLSGILIGNLIAMFLKPKIAIKFSIVLCIILVMAILGVLYWIKETTPA